MVDKTLALVKKIATLCRQATLLATLLATAGCASVEFYVQAVVGQTSLLLARRDAQAVIDDPATDPALAGKLRQVSALLRYAEDELALPVGGRYQAYVELADYPVWYVVAAPEFAVDALRRCYPVIGCALYRGYFSRRGAQREAARLAALGHDVHIGGAAAYSTLGWFDDPVFSTFIRYDDAALADILFHELAHGVVYVRGDSAFNEAFASFVGNAGTLRWLGDGNGDADAYRQRRQDERAFAHYLAHWRGQLERLYKLPIAEDAMRVFRAEMFAAMHRCYQANRQQFGGSRFSKAFAKPFNNARLALAGAYADWTPAFAELFRAAGSDWPAFYRAAEELGRQPEHERRATLDSLAENLAPADAASGRALGHALGECSANVQSRTLQLRLR